MQHGALARWQLRALGLSDREVARRLDRHLLHRVFRSVYLLGHMGRSELTLPTAGLLAAGAGALSNFTAAGLVELRRLPEGLVDVTLPGARRKPRPGLHIHGDQLPSGHTTHIHGLPITTPARTVVDLARLVPRRELERLVDQVLIKDLATIDGLRAVAHRTAAILRILDVPHDIGAARSRAEAKLMRLLRAAGLPLPEQNVEIAGFECDLVWRRERVIAEYDPWRYHHTPLRLARDRAKNNAVQVLGYAIFRYTDEIHARPEPMLAQLAVELARRRAA